MSPPKSPAARFAMVMNLLGQEREYDEHGDFIGYSPQLISAEEARRMLAFPDASEEPSVYWPIPTEDEG